MYIKKWLPSPFFEARGNYPLDMIILHHIGSQDSKLYSVNGTISWFTDINAHKNKDTGKIENKVSAHYIIPRQQHAGNDLYHLVEDVDITYHAGVSQWTTKNKLRKYINRYSIGIEMEGDGNLVDYTDYQYEVLSWLVKDLINRYNIPESNIVGHEDIAPGRKIDPGKLFDWKKLRMMLNPPIIIENVQVSKQEPIVPTKNEKISTIPIVSSPQEISPIKEESFFMEDGSRTHNVFMQFFRFLVNVLLRKSKTS